MEINKNWLRIFSFNWVMIGFFIPIGVMSYGEGMYFDLAAGLIGVSLLLIANRGIYTQKLLVNG